MSSSQQDFYTEMPNKLMGVLMDKSTNASVKAILTVIARKTYGFHKKTDEISLTQFEKETKLSRPTVVAALEKLKSVKLIIQLSKGRSKYVSSEWKIDLSDWENKLVKLTELVKNSDIGLASPLVKPPLHTKHIQKKLYNYQEKSKPYKETNLGVEPQPLPNPQPKGETPTDVVFLSHLKRLKPILNNQLEEIGSRLDEYKISADIDVAINGIVYYVRKYKVVCGIDHPRYYKKQLHDCMVGFLRGIWEIEQENVPLDEIVVKAIDRWFATTSSDPNNLRLSHFVGNDSFIFSNCIEAAIAEYYATYERSENANS